MTTKRLQLYIASFIAIHKLITLLNSYLSDAIVELQTELRATTKGDTS